jgi:hypothetical protein
MQLLLEHSQKGSLWAKYELLGQEQALVDRYNIRSVVLVEGNPRQERDRAMKMAIGPKALCCRFFAWVCGF